MIYNAIYEVKEGKMRIVDLVDVVNAKPVVIIALSFFSNCKLDFTLQLCTF